MVLDHPVIFPADEWLQQHGCDVGMVVTSQRVANVVQQCADHVFLVLAVLMRQRGSLEAVRQTIDRKAAKVAIQQLQVVQQAARQSFGERPNLTTDNRPILLRPVAHVAKHGALFITFHGTSPSL